MPAPNTNELFGATILILEDILEVAVRPSALYKIGGLKTLSIFLEKHICQGLFTIELQTFSLKFH